MDGTLRSHSRKEKYPIPANPNIRPAVSPASILGHWWPSFAYKSMPLLTTRRAVAASLFAYLSGNISALYNNTSAFPAKLSSSDFFLRSWNRLVTLALTREL
jgi:hypothetical protein